MAIYEIFPWSFLRQIAKTDCSEMFRAAPFMPFTPFKVFFSVRGDSKREQEEQGLLFSDEFTQTED